jgi:uncharacterized protein (UPF0262 family)
MPLEGVVLDERLAERGSEAQRADWETTVRELLANAVCKLEGPATLFIRLQERGFDLEINDATSGTIGSVTIEHEQLTSHIDEYLDIVRQMTSADSLNQMEALDMAKKVTHDRAGRVLKKALREYGFDLETSRRLFTLLLSLKVDTTRLAGLRGHRRFG